MNVQPLVNEVVSSWKHFPNCLWAEDEHAHGEQEERDCGEVREQSDLEWPLLGHCFARSRKFFGYTLKSLKDVAKHQEADKPNAQVCPLARCSKCKRKRDGHDPHT